jgi:hypothetical protein
LAICPWVRLVDSFRWPVVVSPHLTPSLTLTDQATCSQVDPRSYWGIA